MQVNKPLPLKQRTSSVDARKDFNAETWYSVLGLLRFREWLVTVDNFSVWRRHLTWAKEDGKDLREHLTQRYASSMVFMSLLLSTELNILFNSSTVTSNMRESLQEEEYWRVEFWIGITIIFSAVLTLLSLISTYTAWSMVSCVDPSNAHCVFRSSIGQYVAELPRRLIVGSIYTFLLWVMLFFFVLMPIGYWSTALAVVSLALFLHTICVLSAFGRIIMHSGAMAKQKIFEPNYEKNLLPHSLHTHLLAKARSNLSKNTSILRQYRSNSRPIDGFYFDDELGDFPKASEEGNNSGREQSFGSVEDHGMPSLHEGYYRDSLNHLDMYPSSEPRDRANSTVRFADEVDMVTSSPPKHNNSLVGNSVSKADIAVSQLTTTSSSGDTTETVTDESKSEHNTESGNESTKPPRPGVVRRDRSNTTVDNGLEALFRTKNPRRSPDTVPLPLPSRTRPPASVRVGSDENLNLSHGSWFRPRPSVDTRSYTRPDKRHSTGSLLPAPPAQPGKSVLENAAKIQGQWRSSSSDHSRSEQRTRLPPPSPPTSRRSFRPQSSMESDSSLQEFWVNSSPRVGTKQKVSPMAQQSDQSSQGAARPSTALYEQDSIPLQVPEPSIPLPSSLVHASSSNGGLSSIGGSDTIGAMSLSEEEEEAFARDYGLDSEGPWPSEATETVRLLGNDRLEQATGTQSYMSVDNSTMSAQK